MTESLSFPPLEELQNLPVHGFEGLLKFYSEEKWKAKEKGSGQAPRVLVRDTDFLEVVETLLEIKLRLRELRAYSSQLKMIPPPVHRNSDKTDYYVYPDHFDLLAVALTLRSAYGLPLNSIQPILEHFPADQRHLIIERKLSLEDLLEISKLPPKGFGIKDLVMAKACDVMLQDVLPSSRALTLATEPGDALAETEERLISERLEEIKSWISSGRRREFLRRESAEDLKNLTQNRLILKKITKKIVARKARRHGRK